jgi:hypothetical protein
MTTSLYRDNTIIGNLKITLLLTVIMRVTISSILAAVVSTQSNLRLLLKETPVLHLVEKIMTLKSPIKLHATNKKKKIFAKTNSKIVSAWRICSLMIIGIGTSITIKLITSKMTVQEISLTNYIPLTR